MTFDLGVAGATVLTKSYEKLGILIGADTRISSDMMVAALTAGICSVGVNVFHAGIVPAPTVAYLVRKYGLSAGIMVSASHNHFADNGIKFYNGQGHKLTDEIEDEITAIFEKVGDVPQAHGNGIGKVICTDAATVDYADFLAAAVQNVDLRGKKIVLDCANGATYRVAPMVFAQLGAEVNTLFDTPDGININADCGSTHVDKLAQHVKAGGFDMGFAFDGDGDRCFAVDENGGVLDGDMIMAVIGKHWYKKGLLSKNTIVATIMSNLGFFNDINRAGLNAEQTKVGDRYVLEKMIMDGYNLGGEQSGHIICLDHHTTGDGTLTALVLASIVQETGKTLSQLNTVVKLPQVMINAKIPNAAKDVVLTDSVISAEIAAAEKKFAGRGRVNVRPSGTEPLIRVMIEGDDLDEITAEAKRIAKMMENLTKE